MAHEWECEMEVALRKSVTDGTLVVTYKRDQGTPSQLRLCELRASVTHFNHDGKLDHKDTDITITVREGLTVDQVKDFGDRVAELAFAVQTW